MASIFLKLSSVEVLLFVAFLTLLSFGNLADGKHVKTKTKANHGVASVRSTVSLWGNFAGKIIYEGCFEISGQPSKLRTDSQNNNFFCNEFCTEEGKRFSATSEDRCLCLDNLPSKRLEQDKCNSRCPDADYNEAGSSCGGFGCCGSKQNNAVSVYKHAGGSQTKKRAIQSGILEIQGCFDDKKNGIITESRAGRRRTDSANTALRCAEFCSGKGYAVASLRNDFCACNNDLPLDRLYKGTDSSKECNVRCAGVLASSAPCEREECCGGDNADNTPVYTVIVVGNVDVLKQVMTRIHGNLRSDSTLRPLEQEFGANLCGEDWTYFKGSCVRYFETRKYHSDAKEACRSHNAELLTLSYEQDIDAFPAPPTTSYVTYYVGLEYRDTNAWFWSSGEPLTYRATDMMEGFDDYPPSSCGGLNMNKGAEKSRNVVLIERGFCTSYAELPFICQRFGKVSAVAMKRTSGGASLEKYTLNMKHPEAIEITTPDPNTQNNRIDLSLQEFEEKMTQKDRLSSENLASYDAKFPNKDSSENGQFTYQHQVQSSESTEVSITGGMSYTVGISTEFETSYFGLASHKISAEFSTTGSWEKGTTTASVESTTESYSFQLAVPKRCDAYISIMKEVIPVRKDWRAKFYISGKVEVTLMDTTKALDLSRLISGPDRYVYGFGFSKFNERPAIVPQKTLDCIDESQSTTETLNEEKKPVTVTPEK